LSVLTQAVIPARKAMIIKKAMIFFISPSKKY
jgi:hypothetical protein